MKLEDLAVGVEAVTPEWQPSRVQLFRFSAVTGNAHRIHWDADYARAEGYPDVLVQAHLHGNRLVHLASTWLGPEGRLVKFRWENRKFVVAEEVVRLSARVTSIDSSVHPARVELEMVEHNAADEVCVLAWATVEFAAG